MYHFFVVVVLKNWGSGTFSLISHCKHDALVFFFLASTKRRRFQKKKRITSDLFIQHLAHLKFPVYVGIFCCKLNQTFFWAFFSVVCLLLNESRQPLPSSIRSMFRLRDFFIKSIIKNAIHYASIFSIGWCLVVFLLCFNFRQLYLHLICISNGTY